MSLAAFLLAALAASPSSAQDPCTPQWLPTFGRAAGANGQIEALVAFDDGGGPALFAGGWFTSVGGVAASHVAKWDGTSWSALGSGTDAVVRALAVHDDGSGPALYAAGDFESAGGITARYVARWNGTSWSRVGSGATGTGMDAPVRALAEFGGDLVAGGSFTRVGTFGLLCNHVARWNGTSWQALRTGTNGDVFALRAFGGALYAGGAFTSADGVAASRIARFDGVQWSALGSGTDAPVRALAVHDAGSGPRLVVGGEFTAAGPLGTASHVAEWTGSAWNPLGPGVDGTVRALASFDDGSGPALFAGGSFGAAGGASARRIARYRAGAWSALGTGVERGSEPAVLALAVFEEGGGPALFAAGRFLDADGVPAGHVARWRDAAWTATGDGLAWPVAGLAVHDDGSGPALVVADRFQVERWDGSGWSELAVGADDGSFTALGTFDAGAGEELYAADGQLVGRWDATGWSAVGAPSPIGWPLVAFVWPMVAHDGGLFVGGVFSGIDGLASRGVARFDGASWSALPPLVGYPNDAIYALAVHDAGAGPELYAGGERSERVVRWDGASWTPLPNGPDGPVRALCSFDDGSGAALFVAGEFAHAGGGAASRIARWDGASWAPLGSGTNGAVRALCVFDDGSGPALYAAGDFTVAGGIPANRIARWDGAAWAPLGSGTSGRIDSLAVLGSHLIVAGEFASAPDSGDSYLARWGCDSTPPVLACPASVVVADGFDAPGELVTFTVTATDDVDAAPAIVCVPPSGSVFPRGTTLVHCTATDAAGNESTCQFPVTVQPKARSRSL